MAVTTLPNASVQARDDSVLNAGIAAADTTITVAPQYKWVAGVKTQGGFDSTAGFCMITDGSGAFEYISFDANSVNSTTKVSTLTGVRRGLSPVAATYTAATGIAWDAGSRIFIVDYPLMWQNMVNSDGTQTITGTKTFSAPLIVSGTASYLQPPSLTTAQRTSLSGSPKIVYDSDLGVHYQNIGGAWSTFATGTTVLAANNTAGKVDIATAAEVAAGTATDATSGGLNVIPVSIVKPTSTGAVSGTVPCLNTSVMLDGTLGGLGAATPALGTVLIGAGAGLAMTTIGPGTTNQVPKSNGTTIAMGNIPTYGQFTLLSVTDSATLGASSTADFNFDNHTYTIPANDLATGVAYTFRSSIALTWAAGDVETFVKLGTTKVLTLGDWTPNASATFIVIEGTVYATAAAGASVTVRAEGLVLWNTSTKFVKYEATAAIATNGTLILQLGAAFRTSNAGNNMIMKTSRFSKISTSAF